MLENGKDKHRNVCMQRQTQYPGVIGAGVNIPSLLTSVSHVWGSGCSKCCQGGNFTPGGLWDGDGMTLWAEGNEMEGG